MKIFFDTNVYVAEALLGAAAEAMLSATQKGRLAHLRINLATRRNRTGSI